MPRKMPQRTAPKADNGSGSERVTLSLNPEVHEYIKQLAVNNGVSFSAMVADLLDKGITADKGEPLTYDDRMSQLKREAEQMSNDDDALVVILCAFGNPDRDQDPDKLVADTKFEKVYSLTEASQKCQAYIEETEIGGGNWTGGAVYHEGSHIANISYNGRIWDPAGNEIAL